MQRSRAILSGNRGAITPIVLVVSAALLVHFAWTLYLLTEAKRAGESSTVRLQMANLHALVASLVRGENSCRIAFGGPMVNCYSGSNPLSCPPPDRATAQAINLTLNTPTDIRLYRRNGTEVLLSATTNNTFDRLLIRNLTLTPVSEVLPTPVNGRVFLSRLTIDAEMPVGLIGGTRLVRDIWLSVKVRSTAPHNIYSCNGITVADGATPKALPVCVPGEGITAVGNELKCVRMICPGGAWGSGSLVIPPSYDSDGNLICP